MAARVPRRNFATPFVLTLVTAPACHSSAPPPQAPPPTEQAPPSPTAPPSPAEPPAPTKPPPVVMRNPPPPSPTPDPQPPPAAQQASWRVFRAKDGCMAAIKVAC